MFTLKDFKSLPCIYDVEVLTARENIERVPIEHIAVIELPVEDFIRDNELVLTTAIGCLDDIELFISFVKNVYLSKAAALVLSIKDKNYKVPQDVIEYAESINFPILRIPWDCRFSEIIEAVLIKIREYNKEKSELYINIQKELLSSYLNSMDLSRAAHILSIYLDASIVIVDVDYIIKGASKNIDVDLINMSSLLKDFQVLANIQIKDTLYGYVLTPEKNKTSLFDTNDFEYYLTMPLSLWFDKENVIDSTKLKLASDFIWNLALDKFDSEESMNTKARLMGFNLQKPYTCIIGEFAFLGNMSQPDLNYKSLHNNEMKDIVNQIRLLGQSFNRDIMITYRDNFVLLYIENTQCDTVVNIHRFLDAVDDNLKNYHPFLRWFWGISEIKYEKTNFSKYYFDAKLALDLSQKTTDRKTRNTYEDTNILRILACLSKENEILEMVNSVLKNLIDYDKSKNSRLMVTLKAFINNNYNISRTARALHLHRQSLIYRLEKIKELTNLDLDNHDNLFLIETCTRLYSD